MEAHASSGFPSDTHQLVEACIARVRETARLDDDAVLPPFPVEAPRCNVVMLTKNDTAGSAAGSAQASSTPAATAGDALGTTGKVDNQRVSRRSKRGVSGSRWAIFLCAFVAGSFASAAFLASPLGNKPSVARVREAARTHVSHAVSSAASALHSIRG